MSEYKIQKLDDLRKEMKAVAKGEKPAPPDARRPSFNSVEALTRLLTPENRRLLAIIRDSKPQPIEELARLTGRAGPNVNRALEKLRAAGLVRMEQAGRRKISSVTTRRIMVEIDPCANNDRLQIQFLANFKSSRKGKL